MAQRPNVASTDELAGKIQPVILGADYSCYAYVRAFWEAYHVRSIIYAGSDIKSISRTKFADYRVEEGVDSEDVLVPLLKRVGDQLCVEGRVPFLVTCGDFYARIVSKHKQELERWFCTPVVDFDVLDFVTQKQNFYEVCEQVCMAYPKTRFLKKVGYNGICRFDAKYDARDGSYRFLEVNARPGRSSWLVLLSGINYARIQAEDAVLGVSPVPVEPKSGWAYVGVPKAVIERCMPNVPVKERVLAAYDNHTASFALDWPEDSFSQRFWARVNFEHQVSKFKRYLPEPDQP